MNFSARRGLLLLILLLAAFLRVYRLPELPPGLNFDEAGNGVAALEILAGTPKLWWQIGGGKEPLWPYLVAIGTLLWGQIPLTLRLLGTMIGVLTVAAVYPLQVALFRGYQGPYLGLLTMLGLALSGWHLHFSRLGFRAILLPLLSTLAIYFFWRMLETGLPSFPQPQGTTANGAPRYIARAPEPPRRSPYPFLAALCLALSIYAYLAARLLPLVIILFYLTTWLLRILPRRRTPPASSPPKIASPPPPFKAPYTFIVCFLLLLSPLMIHFLLNPADFAARSGSVSIFNPAWHQGDLPGTIWRTLTLTLSTFLALNGDANPLVNLPHQPALSPLLTIFFFLGLLTSLISLFSPLSFHLTRLSSLLSPPSSLLPTPSPRLAASTPHHLLLAWWLVMLLPALLAPEGAPHHLRLIGCLVPTYAFIALGLATTLNGLNFLLKRKSPHPSALTSHPSFSPLLLLPLIVFAITGWQTSTNYFVRWPASTDFTLPFDLHIGRLAADIAAAPANTTYVVPMDIRAGIEARHYSLDYLLPVGASYTYLPVDEQNAEKLLTQAASGKDDLRIVRWTEDKHIEADAKEIVSFLLATQSQLQQVETLPVYNVEYYYLVDDCGAAQLGAAAPTCTPGDFKLPPIDQPVGANFEGLLRLETAYIPPSASPGSLLPLALTFTPLSPMQADYKISLRLLSSTGDRVAQKDRVLLHNFHQGTALWPPESVNEYYLLPIPQDTPPGAYTVAVVVYHPETTAPLVAEGVVEVAVGKVLVGEE